MKKVILIITPSSYKIGEVSPFANGSSLIVVKTKLLSYCIQEKLEKLEMLHVPLFLMNKLYITESAIFT